MNPPPRHDGSQWPAVIIGGGPAGAAAAGALARAGTAVLLLERERPAGPGGRGGGGGKVCGGCLNAAALRELQRLGVGEGLRSIAAPLSRVRVRVRATQRATAHAEGRRRSTDAVLPLGGSLAVGRDELDPRLRAAAASAGAEVIEGVSAGVIDRGLVEVRPAGGGPSWRCRGDVILACDGLGGRGVPRRTGAEPRRRADLPGSRIGIGTILPWPPEGDPPPGELLMLAGDRGYLGLVRLTGDRMDLAAAVAPAAIEAAGGAGAWIAATMRRAGIEFPGDPLEGLRVRGTPRLATRATRPAADGVLQVGDAMAYAEPFSGQCIAWALEGGRLAGELVAVTGGGPEVERAWVRTAAGLRRRQTACRLLAAGLRVPGVPAVVAGMMRRTPRLAGRGLAAIDRGPRRDLAAAGSEA